MFIFIIGQIFVGIKRGDCRTEGCGVNAVCTEVELDKFECKCPPGTKGEPQVHCKPGMLEYYVNTFFLTLISLFGRESLKTDYYRTLYFRQLKL